MIEIFMSLISSEFVLAMFTPEMMGEFFKTMAVLAVAYATFGKKITTHFDGMKNVLSEQLEGIKKELKQFKAVVKEDLTKGEKRMSSMEDRIEKLEKSR